jgi:hypothetical protein
MRIAIDWDGTVVSQDRPYDDLVTPMEFIPGAKEGLLALKRAGHVLLLWSARASRALLYDPLLDPLVRAGAAPMDRRSWLASRHLHRARYEQMIDFVNRELAGIFDAIDDGQCGKPLVDLFIDDRSMAMRGPATWARISRTYGEAEPLFDQELTPELLDTPVARLNLVPTGKLKDIIDRIGADLRAAGIMHFDPIFALGDSGFWCADRALTINLPWFLATEQLFQAAQPRYPMTWFNIERGVRHEVGHAVGYAFELWKRPDWTATFGDFTKPYPKTSGSWPVKENSPDFVEYVLDSGKGYGQKHPDEDWAETFAAWLDRSFDKTKLAGGAAAKMAYVARVAGDVLTGWPTNHDLGVPKEWRAAYPQQTVREALGLPKTDSGAQ